MDSDAGTPCCHAQAYFVALGVACAMALLLLAPMANLKSYVQREEAAKRRLERKAA
jgi:hypothetical protein